MEWVFNIVEIFICVLEAYLMFDFYKTFFSLRECFQKKYVNVAAVVITAVCVRSVNILGSSTINIVGMQVIYLSLLFGLFVGKTLRKIFCYLIATAIMIGSEFLWIVVMSLPADFSMGQVQDNLFITILSMLCIRLITFILFNITKRVPKVSAVEIDGKNFLLYSIVPISTLGIMICIAYLGIEFDFNKHVQVVLGFFVLTAIIGDIVIFQMFDRYLKNIKKLGNQQLIITKLKLEEKHYEQIDEVNREQASFLHDIRHFMRTIGEMVSENDEEISEILSSLQVRVSDAERQIFCPNRILNAILNEKKKNADEKRIAMRINIAPDFSIDFVENMDLIVIMGNLLDNAIEAAQACENGYIKVNLYSQNDSHFSVVNIENNYIGDIIIKKDVVMTSKTDRTRHGYGIKNANSIAQKYNGYLQYFYKEGVFTVAVVLSNPITK